MKGDFVEGGVLYQAQYRVVFAPPRPAVRPQSRPFDRWFPIDFGGYGGQLAGEGGVDHRTPPAPPQPASNKDRG